MRSRNGATACGPRRATDFAAFSAYRGSGVTLNGESGAERVSVLRVTADFFDVMGVHPSLGRKVASANVAPGGRATIGVKF